jgi:hypothetical protein
MKYGKSTKKTVIRRSKLSKRKRSIAPLLGTVLGLGAIGALGVGGYKYFSGSKNDNVIGNSASDHGLQEEDEEPVKIITKPVSSVDTGLHEEDDVIADQQLKEVIIPLTVKVSVQQLKLRIEAVEKLIAYFLNKKGKIVNSFAAGEDEDSKASKMNIINQYSRNLQKLNIELEKLNSELKNQFGSKRKKSRRSRKIKTSRKKSRKVNKRRRSRK